jgi:hypothetical protein
MQCEDGAIECGKETELCQDSGGFELVGTFCFRVFANQDSDGECRVRIVPCTPKGEVKCEPKPKQTMKKTRKRVA